MFPILKDQELEELPYKRIFRTVQSEFPDLEEEAQRLRARLRAVAHAQREKTLHQVQVTIRELADLETPQLALPEVRRLLERALYESMDLATSWVNT